MPEATDAVEQHHERMYDQHDDEKRDRHREGGEVEGQGTDAVREGSLCQVTMRGVENPQEAA